MNDTTRPSDSYININARIITDDATVTMDYEAAYEELMFDQIALEKKNENYRKALLNLALKL